MKKGSRRRKEPRFNKGSQRQKIKLEKTIEADEKRKPDEKESLIKKAEEKRKLKKGGK